MMKCKFCGKIVNDVFSLVDHLINCEEAVFFYDSDKKVFSLVIIN